MSVKYSRHQIGNGVFLSVITDSKFKTNYVKIRFVNKADAKKASARSIIPNLLVTTNSNFRTRIELNTRLSELYEASIGASGGMLGDAHSVNVSMSCICDKYALENEKVTEECTKILLDCVFNPVCENGAFIETEFNLLKQELIDAIDAEINNRRSYAITQAIKTVFVGEARAYGDYGTRENAVETTNAQTYELYREMLDTAFIDITVGGGGELDSVVKLITERFSKLNRSDIISPEYYSYSPIKQDIARVTETLDIKQAKMVIAYKSDVKDLYLMKLVTSMFGRTPFSKLFVNVREKLQLCYYCSASHNEYKGTILVDSGVDNSNIEKAAQAIDEQIHAIAQGDFTDSELEDTKLLMTGAFKSNYDSIYALAAWYAAQTARGTSFTPEQVNEIVNSYTREQVSECAKSFIMDTVYLLKSEN